MPEHPRADNCSTSSSRRAQRAWPHRIQGPRPARYRRIYPNYASAYAAWKAKAQQTVDNAHMRYFIVHLHRLLDPDADAQAGR